MAVATVNEFGGRGTAASVYGGGALWVCWLTSMESIGGRPAAAAFGSLTVVRPVPKHQHITAVTPRMICAAWECGEGSLTSQATKRPVPVDCSNENTSEQNQRSFGHVSARGLTKANRRTPTNRRPTNESRRVPMWIIPSSLVPRTAAGTRPPLTNALTRMPPSNIAYSEGTTQTLAGSADGECAWFRERRLGAYCRRGVGSCWRQPRR